MANCIILSSTVIVVGTLLGFVVRCFCDFLTLQLGAFVLKSPRAFCLTSFTLAANQFQHWTCTRYTLQSHLGIISLSLSPTFSFSPTCICTEAAPHGSFLHFAVSLSPFSFYLAGAFFERRHECRTAISNQPFLGPRGSRSSNFCRVYIASTKERNRCSPNKRWHLT